MSVVGSEQLRRILNSDCSICILSPHLDDAVLSCGNLMRRNASRVCVVSVFSEAAKGPHTDAARGYVSLCGHSNAADLYAARRAEDSAAMEALGAPFYHLGYADALFRKRRLAQHLPHMLQERARNAVHRYPTYSRHVARGRIALGDRSLKGNIRSELQALLSEISPDLILGPAGIGKHVDHVIIRDLTLELQGDVAFYSDFPYNVVHSADQDFLNKHGLSLTTSDEDAALVRAESPKENLVRLYSSQFSLLFPHGDVVNRPEDLFVRSGKLDRSYSGMRDF